MRRRDLLSALGAAGLGGCLGGPVGTAPTPTPSPTDSGPHPVTPADRRFEVRSRRCGEGRDDATVTVDADVVAVEGVIGGRDTCDTARLAAASLHRGELTVVIEVVRVPTTGTVACAQCLTDIAYAFEATVPADRLDRIRVVHEAADGRSTVTTVEAP